MRSVFRFFFAVTVFTCIGCSGGGGGEGNTGTGRPGTGFRVMHAGIDFPPVDISPAGGEAPVGRVRYGGAAGYFPSSTESQVINLLRANVPSEIVAATPLTLARGDVKTVLLFGDRGRFGEKISVVDDPVVTLAPDQSAIRVLHGAVGAAQIAASAGGAEITGDLLFGDASPYLTVPGGASVIRVRRVADGAILFSATRSLEPGKTYTLLVAGEVGYLVTGALFEG